MLVMWKPTWIAVTQLDAEGPVYQAWKSTPKMTKSILIRFEVTETHAKTTDFFTETPITTATTVTTPEQSQDNLKRGKPDD